MLIPLVEDKWTSNLTSKKTGMKEVEVAPEEMKDKCIQKRNTKLLHDNNTTNIKQRSKDEHTKYAPVKDSSLRNVPMIDIFPEDNSMKVALPHDPSFYGNT